VLLPVFDAEATLSACLASLATQSLRELEVLAVDDGSRDASGAILSAWAAREPRLRVLAGPHRGLVAALNAAAAVARAPLLARMDADDVAHPRRLELQAERLVREPALAVLGCRVRLIGDVGRGMRAYVAWSNRLLEHESIVRDMYVESPLVHPSVMLRRQALEALGGYRDTGGPEDYDLWLRAHALGLRFAKLPKTLLDWRDAPARLTRRDPRYAAARFLAAKRDALLLGPLADERPVVIWGAGPIGKAWGRALREAGRRVAAFVEVSPRKLGQRLAGAPVVAPSAAPGFPGALHLAAVGQPGARARIRAEAARLGLRDGTDLIAVA
jgi:cellulose synthase/poly-beta-1,6-N-acetylglucosamine synthase-like glycosyltransferase